jgi:hypothetical protein
MCGIRLKIKNASSVWPFDLNESDKLSLVFNSDYFMKLSYEIIMQVIRILNQNQFVDWIYFILVL